MESLFNCYLPETLINLTLIAILSLHRELYSSIQEDPFTTKKKKHADLFLKRQAIKYVPGKNKLYSHCKKAK